MGKTIFAAVLAAIVASVATVLLMDALRAERQSADAAERDLEQKTAEVEKRRAEDRFVEIERKLAAVQPATTKRREAQAVEDAKAAALVVAEGADRPVAPDGTPYVSRAELDAALANAPSRTQAEEFEVPKPPEKKTLEEIAREMGLSAGEEANLREILRQSEEEAVRCLFGDKPMDEIRREAKEAKDDPEKQAEMMQTVIGNALPNIGKLMTLEGRTKKKIEGVLGKERAKEFQSKPLKSELGEEFEAILSDDLEFK